MPPLGHDQTKIPRGADKVKEINVLSSLLLKTLRFIDTFEPKL